MKRILLVCILVLSLTVVSLGCASASDESKIKDTVKGFFGAIDNGNYEKAFDYVAGTDQLTQEQKDAAVELLETFIPSSVEIKVKSIQNVEVDGDNATASVVVTMAGEDSPAQDINLVKEDGSWKLSGTDFLG